MLTARVEAVRAKPERPRLGFLHSALEHRASPFPYSRDRRWSCTWERGGRHRGTPDRRSRADLGRGGRDHQGRAPVDARPDLGRTSGQAHGAVLARARAGDRRAVSRRTLRPAAPRCSVPRDRWSCERMGRSGRRRTRPRRDEARCDARAHPRRRRDRTLCPFDPWRDSVLPRARRAAVTLSATERLEGILEPALAAAASTRPLLSHPDHTPPPSRRDCRSFECARGRRTCVER